MSDQMDAWRSAINKNTSAVTVSFEAHLVDG